MKKIRLLFMFAAMMCTATSAWALSGTGTSTNAFSGTFDGNGYTITIALNTTAEYTGLFRYVGSGTIKNLHVAGTFIGLGTSDYDATFTYNDVPFTSSTVVNENIEVTVGGTLIVGSIGISAAATTLISGEATTVTVTPVPSFADYTLTSSKPSVATVAQDGTVTYVGPGTTTITATANDDPTKTASVVITCVAINEVVIGDDAINNNASTAYCGLFQYSITQQIYSPAEVGQAGVIRSIAFKVAAASEDEDEEYSTTSVKIYLGHKNSSTFSSSTDYMTSSDLTLVYSGSPTLGTATGWEKLIFNQNGGVFEYNGTDNLVVVVCKSASSWTGGLKYYYTSVDNSTLGRHDDDESVCADVSSATYSYSTSDYRPSVKFWVEYPFYYISVNGNVCYGTTITVLDGMLFL